MAKRGAYAKGVAKREMILETALALIAHNGYSNATIRDLADKVGMSKTAVLHYFGSKDNLLTEVVRHRDQLALAGDGPDLHRQSVAEIGARMSELLSESAEVPGLIQLFARVSIEATDSDHAGHAYFVDRYTEAKRMIAGSIGDSVQDSTLDPEMIAVLVSAVTDGLQTQWLYDRDLDMGEHLRLFWELIDRAVRATPPATAAVS